VVLIFYFGRFTLRSTTSNDFQKRTDQAIFGEIFKFMTLLGCLEPLVKIVGVNAGLGTSMFISGMYWSEESSSPKTWQTPIS